MEPQRTFSQQQNARAWDAMVARRDRLTRPAAGGDLRNALAAVDPLGWLGPSIAGKRVLCLAAGGGRQSALYAAAGAEVTVVDISGAMLAQDRLVASELGLQVRTVQASMDDLAVLAAESFDLAIHPVSTCYVPDVAAVFREVARVVVPGAIYVSQHKAPTSLQAEIKPGAAGYALTEPYYRRGPLPPVVGSKIRDAGTFEYLHRWEELLGGLCRAGFAIEDFVEPKHNDPQAAPGSFGHRAQFIAPYFRVKARRADVRQRGDTDALVL